MRNGGAIVGGAILLLMGYQGVKNYQNDVVTEQQSRNVACVDRTGCDVGDEPLERKPHPFYRGYVWKLGKGQVEVTCRRDLVLFGRWRCARDHEVEGVSGDPNEPAFPQEIKRGARNLK